MVAPLTLLALSTTGRLYFPPIIRTQAVDHFLGLPISEEDKKKSCGTTALAITLCRKEPGRFQKI